MWESSGFARTDRIFRGTNIPVLPACSAGIFVICEYCCDSSTYSFKETREVQQTQERGAVCSRRKKSSRGYQNMQSFEDVSDEFRGIFSETGESTSETEPDITEKSDELPKPISDSGQTEDEIK